MKFQNLFTDTFDPIMIVDNWYSDFELELVNKELDLLEFSYHDNADFSFKVNARNEKGVLKTNSPKIYYNDINNHSVSVIKKLIRKVDSILFHANIKNTFYNHAHYFATTTDSTIISFYPDNGFYDYHYDYSMFTLIIMLERGDFTGGDLYLKNRNPNGLDGEICVDFKNNRLVVFNGFTEHMVEETKGNGRTTITHFFKF